MIIQEHVNGVVEYNDGQFVEVQTIGVKGTEKNLLLWKMQLHRENTNDSRQEFQLRFPVNTWLDISTTVEVRAQLKPSSETLDVAARLSSQKDEMDATTGFKLSSEEEK